MPLWPTRMRPLPALLALACGAAEQNGIPAGLVVAPMTSQGARVPALPDGGPSDAGSRVAYRPLPPEPRPPPGRIGCARQVQCRREDDEPPEPPFPPPFERCAPSWGKSDSTFSQAETRTRRERDPRACCYVTFSGCR